MNLFNDGYDLQIKVQLHEFNLNVKVCFQVRIILQVEYKVQSNQRSYVISVS